MLQACRASELSRCQGRTIPELIQAKRPVRLASPLKTSAEHGSGAGRRSVNTQICQPQRRELLEAAVLFSSCLLLGQEASAKAIQPGANIFGPKKSVRTEFIPYTGQSFALLLPSKWNPASSKGAYPGIVLKYEDNGDQGNNLEVVKKLTNKRSIKDFGDPKKFLQEVNFLFGENVWQGATRSEGGFKENQVYSTSIIAMEDSTDKKGNEIYKYELLNRTADGTAGGTHILLTAGVNDSQLHIFKVQILDKRWVRGADRDGKGAHNSFTLV